MINTSLCYIEQNRAYLMLHRTKKKNDINQDKWIGIGGKFEENESPDDCVRREVLEETGLVLSEVRYCGIITFISDEYESELMHLFHATGFSGKMKDCEEGELEWVQKDRLRELNLWEGDYIFLKLIEENTPFFSLKLTYQKDRLVSAYLNGNLLK